MLSQLFDTQITLVDVIFINCFPMIFTATTEPIEMDSIMFEYTAELLNKYIRIRLLTLHRQVYWLTVCYCRLSRESVDQELSDYWFWFWPFHLYFYLYWIRRTCKLDTIFLSQYFLNMKYCTCIKLFMCIYDYHPGGKIRAVYDRLWYKYLSKTDENAPWYRGQYYCSVNH